MLKKINSSIKNGASILILILIMLFCSCTNTEIGNPEALFAMNNDAELEAYLKDQYTANIESEQIVTMPDPSEPDESSGAATEEDDFISAEKDDYMVSHENGYFYLAESQTIKIGKSIADSDEMKIIASVKTSGNIEKIFIHNKILIAVQSLERLPQVDSHDFDSIKTGILLLDINNPYAPEKLTEVHIEGQFDNDMTANERLYIINHYMPNISDLHFIEELTLNDMIPSYSIVDDIGQVIFTQRLLSSEDIFRTENPSGSMMTIISVFDLNDILAFPEATALIGNVKNIEMNPSSIYLTQNSGIVYTLNITSQKPVFYDVKQNI